MALFSASTRPMMLQTCLKDIATMQNEAHVAITVQASVFGLKQPYPSTVLLHGYVRCQSYSSTLIPEFAHSIAYTGLSSINTFAPSSLHDPPTISDQSYSKAQALLPAKDAGCLAGGFMTVRAAGSVLERSP